MNKVSDQKRKILHPVSVASKKLKEKKDKKSVSRSKQTNKAKQV